MNKKIIAIFCMVIVISFALASASHAEEKACGSQAKNFWQKLFNYPANVTKNSVDVVTDTAKKTTDVVATEVKTVGEVTSGDTEKAKDLVTEPVKGAAETVASAAEGTVNAPIEAAKQE